MNKFEAAFANKKAFIPFITCGDPNLATSAEVIKAMSENGADIIELGIPFSDPVAEGEVIQSASFRALESSVSTDKIFDMVLSLRKSITTPFVFMTYANVVFSYGADRFMESCRHLDVSGVILPDLPYEEKGEFLSEAKENGVALISLIAPTSKERIATIAKEARGFLYIVSSLGVTGERSKIESPLEDMLKVVRANTNIPCAIGFGISNETQARDLSRLSDGIIVGSSIVKLVAKYKEDAPKIVGEFVAKMKNAINA